MSIRVRDLTYAVLTGGDNSRGVIDSLRVLLATLALLVVDTPTGEAPVLVATVFLAWALFLWWRSPAGSALFSRRFVSWIDAGLLLALFSLAGTVRIAFFPLLLIPVFFAAWRGDEKDSAALAVVIAVVSMVVRGFDEPDLTMPRLIAPTLLLFLCIPLLVVLARRNQAPAAYRALALKIANEIDARQGLESVAMTVISILGERLNASGSSVALRCIDGRSRVLSWRAREGMSELSPAAAFQTAELALSLGDRRAFAYRQGDRWRPDRLVACDVPSSVAEPNRSERETIIALQRIVGHRRLLTVPITAPAVGCVRIIICGDEVAADISALEQLIQVVGQLAPFIENGALRERLVAETAETERARIGRDLHDSAIQPYIGLKFALEALQRRARPDHALADDLADLVNMVTNELAAVREIVSGLRTAPGGSGLLLSNAVQRQTERFAQLFGIEVDLEMGGDMAVSRRLAGELFHIVAEGLSNIRRHTRAQQATIHLREEDGTLSLSIRNLLLPGEGAAPEFMPVSLSERVAALNGTLRIVRNTAATSVIASIPLPNRSHRQ